MALILDELVLSGTVSGSTVTYTHEINHQYGYSIHVFWTHLGSSEGHAKLQASNFPEDHFKDIPDSQCDISTTDTADSVLWSIDGMRYKYVKIVCTSDTGGIRFDGKLTIKRPKPTE